VTEETVVYGAENARLTALGLSQMGLAFTHQQVAADAWMFWVTRQ
jgi:hypothetical protein